jgi:hypothetical protein
MAEYDSTSDTQAHRLRVMDLLVFFASELLTRGQHHDTSKLGPQEKAGFDKFTPLLADSEFGSAEYMGFLEDLKDASLTHHYGVNRHHPEHFENGVKDMTLLDLLEMLADWKAASERHKTGNIAKSLQVNGNRFDIPPALQQILINTASDLGWIEE